MVRKGKNSIRIWLRESDESKILDQNIKELNEKKGAEVLKEPDKDTVEKRLDELKEIPGYEPTEPERT